MLFKKSHLKYKDTERLTVKVWKNTYIYATTKGKLVQLWKKNQQGSH